MDTISAARRQPSREPVRPIADVEKDGKLGYTDQSAGGGGYERRAGGGSPAAGTLDLRSPRKKRSSGHRRLGETPPFLAHLFNKTHGVEGRDHVTCRQGAVVLVARARAHVIGGKSDEAIGYARRGHVYCYLRACHWPRREPREWQPRLDLSASPSPGQQG